jgi:hypothetical protein
MFAALWLAEQGKRVTLLLPADDLGVDTNDMQRGHLAELLAAQDVKTSTGRSRPRRAPSSGRGNASSPMSSPTRWMEIGCWRSAPGCAAAGCTRQRSPGSGPRLESEDWENR